MSISRTRFIVATIHADEAPRRRVNVRAAEAARRAAREAWKAVSRRYDWGDPNVTWEDVVDADDALTAAERAVDVAWGYGPDVD